MFERIDKLFFNLIDHESFNNKYRELNSNAKQLINNVIDRLIFDSYLEDKFMKMFGDGNPKFIRSLQAYLLLSCGDALGVGSKYYSLQDYILQKDNQEREIIIDQFLKANEYNNKTVKLFLRTILDSYSKIQSIKQSFMSFWNDSIVNYKRKIILLL